MARFRTRARTVDMLGRQQIAGIPTAISELFKNAHDAYADSAIVDFFRSDQLFVLRDDGLGMTEDDFEQRWLTLGTESKAGKGAGISAPPVRPGSELRPVLGEKGIGRLAIAAIGPQVLVLSRPLRDGELGRLLVSYVHWGVFELPSVNLDEVDIPVVCIEGGSLPSTSDIRALTDRVSQNVDEIAQPEDKELVARIRSDLAAFARVAPDELAVQLGQPDLRTGPGTQFFIRPASPMLSHGLDESSAREAGPLQKALVGFANTMTPGHAEPALRTVFRDHFAEDAWLDVINESEFFTPAEFLGADHRIDGRFDEFGQFEGRVSVYGEEPVPYRVSWSDARGAPVRCGPFHLDLAYVQGRSNESRLDPEAFALISNKLDLYGGLYVYRDGVRVLPYGNNDVDWLDVEVRRAKSASDWFFSYRRMFGAIEISRGANEELREKAGREGFADNEAYRQFRGILKAFLRQVALDYFRESGSLADRWRDRRQQLVRLDKARQAREGQVRERRRRLGAELDDFFTGLDQQKPQAQVEQILTRLRGQIDGALVMQEPGEAAQTLVDAEESARAGLTNLVRSYEIRRPRGLGLTQALSRVLSAYDDEHVRLTEEVFTPAWTLVEQLVSSAAADHKVAVDRRLRFDRAVEVAVERTTGEARLTRRDLQEIAKGTERQASELARKGQAAVEASITATLAQAASLDVSSLTDTEFVNQRSSLEQALVVAAQAQIEALNSVTEQLRRVVWPTNGAGPEINALDEVEAMETELEALRERAEQDLELTQIGMAVEVVDHEFRRTIQGIRRALQRLKGWADANPKLREPYQDLRSNFEHLDGYLRLLTPLHRRLYRKKVEVVGSQIERFLRDLFTQRLQTGGIELTATDAFRNVRFLQFPSTIYPVFINLVDNAIWWLTDYRGERQIVLDADDQGLVVRDTGPGVSPRDREAIFDLGFSRKLGGSGYGLYISRQVLEREGMSLELSPSRADTGAVFRISPIPADDA